MSTSRFAAFVSSLCLVGLPTFVLADIVGAPWWAWASLMAIGTAVLCQAMWRMQRVVELDRRLHPQPPPPPPRGLRESYERASLAVIDALGLRRQLERFAEWLGRLTTRTPK